MLNLRAKSEELLGVTQIMAVWEAREFIRGFVQEHWPQHSAMVSIDCSLTLDELHSIGHLPSTEGIRICSRLIRVPVIHEEIASALWERLAWLRREKAPTNADAYATDLRIREKMSVANLVQRLPDLGQRRPSDPDIPINYPTQHRPGEDRVQRRPNPKMAIENLLVQEIPDRVQRRQDPASSTETLVQETRKWYQPKTPPEKEADKMQKTFKRLERLTETASARGGSCPFCWPNGCPGSMIGKKREPPLLERMREWFLRLRDCSGDGAFWQYEKPRYHNAANREPYLSDSSSLVCTAGRERRSSSLSRHVRMELKRRTSSRSWL
ncbi:hypothetical protein VTK56DRAFT_2840 [Thermocarpiscus australiensis]